MRQNMPIQPYFLYNFSVDNSPTIIFIRSHFYRDLTMNKRKNAKSELIYQMEYNADQIDYLVDEIKGTSDVLAKVIFAGFNIVFLVILGVILVKNFGL